MKERTEDEGKRGVREGGGGKGRLIAEPNQAEKENKKEPQDTPTFSRCRLLSLPFLRLSPFSSHSLSFHFLLIRFLFLFLSHSFSCRFLPFSPLLPYSFFSSFSSLLFHLISFFLFLVPFLSLPLLPSIRCLFI